MNDRIRELIVNLEPDAFMTYKGYLYHSSDPKVLEHSDPEPLYTRQELVKFAELIVRECCEQVEQAKHSPFVSLDDAKRMQHFVNVTKKKITKHLGVGE